MVVPGRNTPNGTDMRFYLQACRGGEGELLHYCL